MKIIADSGSTKTHWIAISKGKQVKSFFSEGINPYFLDSKNISFIVADCFSSFKVEEVNEVQFYGAGCSLADKCLTVYNALLSVFPSAHIQVQSDLLASAHALFGNKVGIACILGTGSNAAVYDGSLFSNKIQSLGYLLGDEGSGSYIGRQLLQAYLRNIMPDDLRKDFIKEYQLDVSGVLENLYKKPFPNRYLASFTSFASKHSHHGFIQNIIRSSFNDFIKFQLNSLNFNTNIEVGFVGSIAYYFQDILKEELHNAGYRCGTILQEPIHNLVKYHL